MNGETSTNTTVSHTACSICMVVLLNAVALVRYESCESTMVGNNDKVHLVNVEGHVSLEPSSIGGPSCVSRVLAGHRWRSPPDGSSSDGRLQRGRWRYPTASGSS